MRWTSSVLLGVWVLVANALASEPPTATGGGQDCWKSRALIFGRLIRVEKRDGMAYFELEMLAEIFGQLHLSGEKKLPFIRVPTGPLSPVHIDVPAAPCNVLVTVYRPDGILRNEDNKDTLWVSFARCEQIDEDIRLLEVERFPEKFVREILSKLRDKKQ